MATTNLLAKVKENLILDGSADDALIQRLITAATYYAEGYQHLDAGYYTENDMSATTEQGVIMMASLLYESRDGATAGFFSNSSNSMTTAQATINMLLQMDREWMV